jgi:hypothetical protein
MRVSEKALQFLARREQMLLRHPRRTADDRADLGVRAAVDFVQEDDVALDFRELGERRLEAVAQFVRFDVAERIVGARGGRRFEQVGITHATRVACIQCPPPDDLS